MKSFPLFFEGGFGVWRTITMMLEPQTPRECCRCRQERLRDAPPDLKESDTKIRINTTTYLSGKG